LNFKSLPKVELHLHFDCSLSYAVASRLNPSITLEDYRRDFIAPAKCANPTEVLSRAVNSIALMQTEEQLQLVTFDVFEQLQQEHVYYYEKLHTTFGWDETYFLQCNLNAIRASFLPEAEKQRLENRLREGYHNL